VTRQLLTAGFTQVRILGHSGYSLCLRKLPHRTTGYPFDHLHEL